ncbi:MAG: hypothetical protein M1511_15975 [Deltaproteobacteria bacterium]|nr:hypothetical protein [Deltaproteobacteria bacterium]
MKNNILKFVDGAVVQLQSPTCIPPWIFRYDRLCLTILDAKDIGAYWFKNCLEPLCKDIANPGNETHYSIAAPRSYHEDYYKVKRMESPTELIQIYYHPRKAFRPIASIEFTVPDKANGYAYHVQEILRVENILKKYSVSFHVGSVELCLDAPTEQEYNEVTGNLFLKNSTPGKDDFYFIDDERHPTGKAIRRDGFHPDNENKYVKGREASVHLKSYRLRNRIELTFTRNFLKRQQLNYFAEILRAGPSQFFDKLYLYSFDFQRVLDFRNKCERLGRNPGLVMMGPIALKNLFRKTSGEILLTLMERLDWKACRVKKQFGTNVDFPPFYIETGEEPYILTTIGTK